MITTFLAVLFLSGTVYAQKIITSDFIGSNTKEEITAMFGNPLFENGIEYYKITYESSDAKGNSDTLSALLIIPDSDAGYAYPLAFYEHGTSDCKECVPSRLGQPGGEEGQLGFIFAGMGFVTLLPDYVGMGDGRGFQTYVHGSTSFQASEDLLIAFKDWAPDNDIKINDQLFITGYSQGGYASMAFHKGMQEKYGAGSVTAAAHNSGPYSLSGVMRELILTDIAYNSPAYIPNTMLGINEVYEIYGDISEFFKPEFLSDIQDYYDGSIRLSELNQKLINTLIANYGSSVANKMLIPEILENIRNNPDFMVNQILVENDVYRWKPESPTRIFYCQADDQVPYQNAILAIDTMYARGADPDLVKAENINPDLSHTQCVNPAIFSTAMFFNAYKQIITGTKDWTVLNAKIYPNPVQDRLFIETNTPGEKVNIKIMNLVGKTQMDFTTNNFNGGIDLKALDNGMHLLQITTEDGNVSVQKFIVGK